MDVLNDGLPEFWLYVPAEQYPFHMATRRSSEKQVFSVPVPGEVSKLMAPLALLYQRLSDDAETYRSAACQLYAGSLLVVRCCPESIVKVTKVTPESAFTAKRMLMSEVARGIGQQFLEAEVLLPTRFRVNGLDHR